MIAEYVQSLLPGNLPAFVGELPSQRENAIAVIEYSGNANTEYFDDSTMFEPVVKIVVRNHSYPEAQAQMKTVVDTLHRYHDETLLLCLVVGQPMYLGRGDLGLHEFQVTFRTNIKE